MGFINKFKGFGKKSSEDDAPDMPFDEASPALGDLPLPGPDGTVSMDRSPASTVTSTGSSSATGVCPDGTSITGPVLLYLQSATVPPTPADQLGLQSFAQHEVTFFTAPP